MSQQIADLHHAKPKTRTRAQMLALPDPVDYSDGMTKQCHRDECDIQKIMARFDITGTISHLSKHEAVYADFSDFDFHEQTRKLTRGREIFDELPAELRKEFGQSPSAFFAYVNDPKNADDLREKLPGLAKPGQQLPKVSPPSADDPAPAEAEPPTPPKADKPAAPPPPADPKAG